MSFQERKAAKRREEEECKLRQLEAVRRQAFAERQALKAKMEGQGGRPMTAPSQDAPHMQRRGGGGLKRTPPKEQKAYGGSCANADGGPPMSFQERKAAKRREEEECKLRQLEAVRRQAFA